MKKIRNLNPDDSDETGRRKITDEINMEESALSSKKTWLKKINLENFVKKIKR